MPQLIITSTMENTNSHQESMSLRDHPTSFCWLSPPWNASLSNSFILFVFLAYVQFLNNRPRRSFSRRTWQPDCFYRKFFKIEFTTRRRTPAWSQKATLTLFCPRRCAPRLCPVLPVRLPFDSRSLGRKVLVENFSSLSILVLVQSAVNWSNALRKRY